MALIRTAQWEGAPSAHPAVPPPPQRQQEVQQLLRAVLTGTGHQAQLLAASLQSGLPLAQQRAVPPHPNVMSAVCV